MDTFIKCKEAGIQFIPMILEIHGGWGESANKAIQFISKQKAAKTAQELSTVSLRIVQ